MSGPQSSAPLHSPSNAADRSARTPLICVVDDDAPLLRALRNLIRAAGLLVETFPSADAFLQSDARKRADCVLVDLQMPGVNGGGLLAELRQTGSRLPVIMLTAHDDEQTRQRCLRSGAAGFLTKPFASADLFEEIRLACDRHQLRYSVPDL